VTPFRGRHVSTGSCAAVVCHPRHCLGGQRLQASDFLKSRLGLGTLADGRARFTFDQAGPPVESDVTADSSGNVFSEMGNTCPTQSGFIPLVSAQASGTLAQGQTVETPVVNDPCFKSTGG
jgi:hypothetical protein